MKVILFVVLIAGIILTTDARTRFVRQLPRDIHECIKKNCLTTTEYNPVCGSDGNTYENPAKLECAAQFCSSSRGVTAARRGACQSQS